MTIDILIYPNSKWGMIFKHYSVKGFLRKILDNVFLIKKKKNVFWCTV